MRDRDRLIAAAAWYYANPAAMASRIASPGGRGFVADAVLVEQGAASRTSAAVLTGIGASLPAGGI